MIRSLDAPVHITVDGRPVDAEEARWRPAVDHVQAEGVYTRFTTRDPAAVLSVLAEKEALTGLRVKGFALAIGLVAARLFRWEAD